MVWNLSASRKQMGHWYDTERVSEEYFLEFLKNAFIKDMMTGSNEDIFTKFSSDLTKNKIVFTDHEQIDLVRRIANIKTSWESLPQSEITREWEKDQIELALKSLWLNGSRSASEAFKLDMMGSKPKPKSFLAMMDWIVDYHAQVVEWHRRGARYHPNSYPQSSSSSSNPSLDSKYEGSKRKRVSGPFDAEKSKRQSNTSSRRECWTCGRTHAGECRHASSRWANHEKKPWAVSEQGKFWKSKGFEACPSTENPIPKQEKGREK